MTRAPLEGKKVAILVETEFVPEEISEYRKRFGELGAEVHFMSRLWGRKSLTFVSDVDGPRGDLAATRQQLEMMEVSIDFQEVELEDYAAVIMAANYTSVRLRYFEPPRGEAVRPEMVQSAPAVQFFARAMRNPRIVKGALCHGLWILTPVPELLRDRRVICHEVVLADVYNAGAIYTTSPNRVVVDDDLVTGRSRDDIVPFIEAIADRIRSRDVPFAAGPSSRSPTSLVAPDDPQ